MLKHFTAFKQIPWDPFSSNLIERLKVVSTLNRSIQRIPDYLEAFAHVLSTQDFLLRGSLHVQKPAKSWRVNIVYQSLD
jgi:hypothetical protein